MSSPRTAALCLESFAWSETLVPSTPAVDGSGALAGTAYVPTGLAVAELLHARIRALSAENRRLEHRNRLLTIALDDALDRATAHALCCDNERLLVPAGAHRPVLPVGSFRSATAPDGRQR